MFLYLNYYICRQKYLSFRKRNVCFKLFKIRVQQPIKEMLNTFSVHRSLRYKLNLYFCSLKKLRISCMHIQYTCAHIELQKKMFQI